MRHLLLSCAVVAVAVCGAGAEGVDLDLYAAHRGWYAKSVDERFAHTNDEPGLPENNYYTGRLYSDSARVFFDYHSYFVWDLAAVGEEVASATFVVSFGEYLGNDPTESVELRSFSGSVEELVTGTGNDFEIFDELGSGADLYGFFLGSPDDEGTTVSLPLPVAAVDAINQARGSGYFVMGGLLTTMEELEDQAVFSHTYGDEYETRLLLTFVPSPGPLATGCAVAAMAFVRRRHACERT